ncbi:MAG TPA: hypothetical protein PLF48_00080 [Chitinophagales bacterium]|nr:hypothetical protein [Chitinophagales bacterium]
MSILRQYISRFIIASCFVLFSCSRIDNTKPENNKIRQSNWVVEDEVNGRLSSNGNIIESTNFYYNNDGTLNRLTVYDDTTYDATLIKDVFFDYTPTKVIVHGYHITGGYFRVDFNFNANKQVVSILDTNGFGLRCYYSYRNLIDSFTLITDTSYAVNFQFQYDINNNLIKYDIAQANHIPIGRIYMEYGTENLDTEFDLKFYSSGIKVIYTGGVNIIPLLGLNIGIPNMNNLLDRKEINLLNGDTVNSYKYGYFYNNNKLTKRNIQNNTDTLFYQFKY